MGIANENAEKTYSLNFNKYKKQITMSDNNNFILKHKDIEVALLQIADSGIIVKVLEILNKGHLPLSCVRESGSADDARIMEWWLRRGIPESRIDYRTTMQMLGGTDRSRLLLEGCGLNLSDHYWIDTEKNGRKWKDVNYYENEFDTEMGKMFFDIKKQAQKYGRNTPDTGSSGNLIKRWEIREDGKRILVKGGRKPYMQEPANEYIATQLCKRLNIPHVPYEVHYENGFSVSKCENMTNGTTELVEAINVYDTIEPSYFENNLYKHFIKCANKLGTKSVVEMLDRMMVLDYIMLNHDRHFNNFGVLRDSENLNNYSMAPIYDTGSSLFNEDSAAMIRLPEYAKVRVQCFDTLDKQLEIVTNWDWFDKSALKGFGKECAEILAKEPFVEKNRAIKLGNIIETRIDEVSRKAEGMKG